MRWWKSVLSLFVFFGAGSVQGVPTFEAVRQDWQPSETLWKDRHGVVLHESRTDFVGRRLPWVALSDVSPTLVRALVSLEDRRFYQHSGVDGWALLGRVADWVRGRRLRGASTLAMQLYPLAVPGVLPPVRRSLWRKVRQIEGAWELQARWSREQVLEAYLNLVTFRGEYQGVGAASQGLFGKAPHGLTEAEAWVLASLVASPNATSEELDRRVSRVVPEEVRAEARQVAARALGPRPPIAAAARGAPHFARWAGAPPASGRTPLVASVQRFATESLRRHLAYLSKENVGEGALVALDNATGEVVAYVGGVDPANQVDGARARRQAGSTLKPFLYGAALERRLLTPGTQLLDSPLEVVFPQGVYQPGNYDHRFRGEVTVRQALAQSLNVPAVRTLLLVGVEPFVGVLKQFGFSELEAADHYGPSLALGSADVTLLELTNAYRTLATGGRFSSVVNRLGESGGDTSEVLSAATSFLVADMLSDRASRAGAFGWENPLGTRFWSAVKTGTSKDMRDNWCVGFSRRYTVGVWVGNFSGAPMWNVSGVSGAAPVWREVMGFLHRSDASLAPEVPAGVVRSEGEFYLAGSEPPPHLRLQAKAMARIRSPGNGAILGWDPDIPPDHQRLSFEAEGASPQFRWRLDGRDLGPVAQAEAWRLVPGAHRLALLDSRGRVKDEARFEVRGKDPSTP